MGNTSVSALFSWFPFDYINLQNNVIKDIQTGISVDVGSQYNTNNPFNFPIYNYDEDIDYLSTSTNDPNQFISAVTYSRYNPSIIQPLNYNS